MIFIIIFFCFFKANYLDNNNYYKNYMVRKDINIYFNKNNI